MKKINLFFSLLIVALVLLVVGGATIAPAVQLQTVKLSPANNANGKLTGALLFDSKGRYAVDAIHLKDAVTDGTVYQFFGYDWQVVYVNQTQKVATFWMADPYTTSAFYLVKEAGNEIFSDGSNIWSNGYAGAAWHNGENSGELDSSVIRTLLVKKAAKMKQEYANFNTKVRPGAVVGTNETTTEQVIPFFAYAESDLNGYVEDTEPTNRLTAYYGIGNDALWLPSVSELKAWNTQSNMIRWKYNTTSSRAWLRTPDYKEDGSARYAACVASSEELTEHDSLFAFNTVEKQLGVRPAIHLDISNISTEYQQHLDSLMGKGNNWWDDDWLKALFMSVCILGIIGVVMVVFAVINKARKAKK